MTAAMKSYLSPQWWAIAECADAYETSCGTDFPNLRSFVQRLSPADLAAGLAELVKIEIERRWRMGVHKQIEDYLRDYPELKDPSVSLGDLVLQESTVRSRHGAPPSLDELKSRFPTLDALALLPPGQNVVATVALGNADIETKRSDSGPAAGPAEAGTIVFDSQKSKTPGESTAGGSSAPTSGASRPLPTGASASTAATIAAMPGFAGGAIGRYSIQKELGAGSFGVVLRCRDDDLKREVAIKLPLRHGPPSADRVKEFLHEAQSAARLRHPGIVTVLDTGQTDDGRVYIVYEFIRGKTLQSRLEEGDYSLEDIVRWVAGSAEALHHAHKNGIVHRDIKPANILLDEDSNPHIADFGLAKMDDQFFRNDAGRVLGTAAYMSPEQAAGQSHWASPQTDIYSLGVMLYQMLTKRLPFGGRTLSEMLEQVKQRIPAPPRTIDDKIPKPLEDICLKAMAKNPADRYSTAADMAADLRTAVAGEPPRGFGKWWIGGLSGAAAAAGLILMLINMNRHPQPPQGGQNGSGTTTIVKLIQPVDALNLAPTTGFEPTTPQLAIHYQAANVKGEAQVVGRDTVLHAGDKVQIHVTIQTPRYLYVYWYGADGRPQRLWPEDPAKQTKTAEIHIPNDRDSWEKVDDELGTECLVVAARDEALDAAALARFEQNEPYAKGDVRVDQVYPLGSRDLSRGLAGVVKSRKNPLNPEFEKTLTEMFAAFHGFVLPHQAPGTGVAAKGASSSTPTAQRSTMN